MAYDRRRATGRSLRLAMKAETSSSCDANDQAAGRFQNMWSRFIQYSSLRQEHQYSSRREDEKSYFFRIEPCDDHFVYASPVTPGGISTPGRRRQTARARSAGGSQPISGHGHQADARGA